MVTRQFTLTTPPIHTHYAGLWRRRRWLGHVTRRAVGAIRAVGVIRVTRFMRVTRVIRVIRVIRVTRVIRVIRVIRVVIALAF